MSFINHFSLFRNTFITIIFVIFLIPALTFSQNITLTIGDATGQAGDSFVPLDITISNLSDTIAGYQFWLQLDRPDIINFHQSYDTISYIMPEWGVSLNSLGGQYYDILVTSTKLNGIPPYIDPPINDELLIRLYLEVADSFVMTPVDSVVNIFWQYEFSDNISFSNPQGESIGRELVEIVDTNCYVCTEWAGDVCLNYVQIAGTVGCDSTLIDTNFTTTLIPGFWEFNNGSFTLLPTCGVSSIDYDIAGLVALVAYMFGGGPEVILSDADCNCDCLINIEDLVCFVGYMFDSGPPPGCESF